VQARKRKISERLPDFLWRVTDADAAILAAVLVD
jgi:hypothetical protein